MAKHVDVDFSELEALLKRAENMQGRIDFIFEEAAKKLARMLLRRVKKRTPVGEYKVMVYESKEGEDTVTRIYNDDGKKGGELKSKWKIEGGVQRKGDSYVISITNIMVYASYVEYGHRQTPGRFVPQIGKTLVNSWVQGKFMLTLSLDEIQQASPKVLEQKITKELRDVFE